MGNVLEAMSWLLDEFIIYMYIENWFYQPY